jgi:electron transport complex protein RnfG
MNELIRLVLSLFIVTFVATGLLSVTYSLTKTVIEQTHKTMFDEQLQQFFPGSDSVMKVNEHYEVYEGINLVGYAVLTTAPGYSSDIELLVGVAKDGTVTGVSVLRQQETPGLGAKVVEEAFIGQFRGRTLQELELTKYGGRIDAITSATISSTAVTSAVRVTVEELS